MWLPLWKLFKSQDSWQVGNIDVGKTKEDKIAHCTVQNPPQILLRIAEEIGDSLQRTLAWDINLNSKRMNQ